MRIISCRLGIFQIDKLAAKISQKHYIQPNRQGTVACPNEIASPEFREPQTREGRPRGQEGEGPVGDPEKCWQYAFPKG